MVNPISRTAYYVIIFIIWGSNSIGFSNGIRSSTSGCKQDIVEAINIAQVYAVKNGYSLQDYDIRSAVLKNDKWWIIFVGHKKTAGDHFAIMIDESDRSKISIQYGG